MTAAQAAVTIGEQPDAATQPQDQPATEPAALDEEQNALLASLIQAMREVADRERETSVSGLRGSVEEAIETLRARAAEGADALRRRSDQDVSGIEDWVRKEIERITGEGDRRTEARRQQLTQQLTDHEQRSQREIEALHARVDEYERELSTFFAGLGEINDPAAFGTAAKRMPRPPTLTNATSAPAAASATEPQANGAASDASSASTPATEASAAPDAPAAAAAPAADESKEPTESGVETEMVEEHRNRLDALGIARNGADAEAGQAEPTTEDPLRARLAELDSQIGEKAAAPAEPSGSAPTTVPTGQEAATAIVVHGLGSFGAITSFKQALERVDGVRGISLSLGPTGEFVYRATHDAGFDLVGAIETIERNPAQIDRQPDGSLRVTVQRTR